MKNRTTDWLTVAEDDLSAIILIIKDAALTHIVAFHAQQAIEKALKAVIEEFELGNFKSHSLKTLMGIISNHTEIEIDIEEEVIAALESLYIESRYPGSIGLLPEGKPTIEDAKMYLDTARQVLTQVRDFLNSDR
ncbi:MAG: HEPN domain-containing protein [Bacteroidales bacterium]